jgi:hypothetical protein
VSAAKANHSEVSYIFSPLQRTGIVASHHKVPRLKGLFNYLMHKYLRLQHQALQELQSRSQVHNVLLIDD